MAAKKKPAVAAAKKMDSQESIGRMMEAHHVKGTRPLVTLREDAEIWDGEAVDIAKGAIVRLYVPIDHPRSKVDAVIADLIKAGASRVLVAAQPKTIQPTSKDAQVHRVVMTHRATVDAMLVHVEPAVRELATKVMDEVGL